MNIKSLIKFAETFNIVGINVYRWGKKDANEPLWLDTYLYLFYRAVRAHMIEFEYSNGN